MTRPQFNTASFQGTVYKMFPASADNTLGSWTIIIDTLPKLKAEPIRVKFNTNQDTVSYLSSVGRIGKGFELTVTGTITSVVAGNSHNEYTTNLLLSNAHVHVPNLYFQRIDDFVKTTDGQFSEIKETDDVLEYFAQLS